MCVLSVSNATNNPTWNLLCVCVCMCMCECVFSKSPIKTSQSVGWWVIKSPVVTCGPAGHSSPYRPEGRGQRSSHTHIHAHTQTYTMFPQRHQKVWWQGNITHRVHLIIGISSKCTNMLQVSVPSLWLLLYIQQNLTHSKRKLFMGRAGLVSAGHMVNTQYHHPAQGSFLW